MAKFPIIAAFLAAIVCAPALGQPYDKADSPKWNANKDQSTAQELPTPFRVQIIEDKANADARKRREAEADHREIEDLAAQKGMYAATQDANAAAQSTLEYTRDSTIISAIGTVLVFGTLVLMIRANQAAVSAAESAERAVQITRDIGNEQMRAYVGIASCTLHVREADIWISIQNFGQTPAKKVIVATSGHCCKVVTDPYDHYIGVIEPGHHAPALIQLGTIDTSVLAKGVPPASIEIAVSYEDMFGAHWIRKGTYHIHEGRWTSIPPGLQIPMSVSSNTSSYEKIGK